MGVLSLLVKLGVDSTAFEMGLKRAQGLGDRFGSGFKSAVVSKLGAALSIAAVATFAKSVVEAADNISDLSEQLNLTTDQIQRLQILSGETGVSFDKLTSVLGKFEQARLKATSGDQDAINTLQTLGLTMKDLNDPQISTLQGAIRIAEAFKNSGRSAEATAAMTEIYGLKLKNAAAALSDYSTTLDRKIISKSDVDTLAKANTLLDEQLRIIKALASPVIAGGITATANALGSITKPSEDFNKRFDRAVVKGFQIQMLKRMPDEALARLAQSNLAAERVGKTDPFAALTPPPIGKPEFEKVIGPKFSLGGAQDPLARIGGFTGFQSAQDTAIRQAIEQTVQLKQIVKNTGKTADRISQE